MSEGRLDAIWIKRMKRGPMDVKVMYPEWGGGAFGEVLNDGQITVGDLVSWVIAV